MLSARRQTRGAGVRVVVIAGDGAVYCTSWRCTPHAFRLSGDLCGLLTTTPTHVRDPRTALTTTTSTAIPVVAQPPRAGLRDVPKLSSVDVSDTTGLSSAVRASLNVDGPRCNRRGNCAADEIPPFHIFLATTATIALLLNCFIRTVGPAMSLQRLTIAAPTPALRGIRSTASSDRDHAA